MCNRSKFKILIADDNPANISVLQKIVEAEYDVYTTYNGEELLSFIDSTKILPDLILLDIMMPGLSGYEVCRQLKRNRKTRDIPIIFVTAYRDNKSLQEAFDSGGTDCISKPVNKVELLARIRSVMLQKQLTQRLIQEEKLKSILEMAGTICHELNQPLQAISGYVELLIEDVPEDSHLHSNLKVISDQVKKMSEITKKLMTITQYKTRGYLVSSSKIIDID